jgi:hypothetical protein
VKIDEWSETKQYDAAGNGSTGELVFARPAGPARVIVKEVKPAAAKPPEIAGLMGSFGVSLTGYSFVGNAEDSGNEGDSQPAGLVFGLMFDVGFAASQKVAVLLRAFGGLGKAEGALASLGAAGPVATLRLGRDWWLGGGIVAGASRADSNADLISAGNDSTVTFQTDLALGPTLELTYVLDQNRDGHWLVSLMPTTLVTTGGEESTIAVPLIVGYRWF